MDFLDPKKKRAYKIRLIVGYCLMAVMLGIGTLILFYEAYGYDVNRETGEVIQNGLVFVDAEPESARIFVDGKYEANTGARLVLPSGEYTVRLERQGYLPWKRTFELAGSGIERLDYPLLFPKELKQSDVKQYDSLPYFASQSLDRRWLLVQHSGQVSSLDVIDLNSQDIQTRTIILPDGIVTDASNSNDLSLVEWSDDNRHVLVKHTFKGGSEFLMIDREVPAESFNVNQVFAGVPIKRVALRDKSFDRLYLLDSAGGLHTAAIASGEATAIADGVKAFKPYGDSTVLYVTEANAPDGKALAMVRINDDTHKLRELEAGDKYVVDLARYDGTWYVASGSSADNRVIVYRDPFDQIVRENPQAPTTAAVLRVDKLEYLSFSANARFLGLQGSSEFAVYDAEHDRQYRYDTELDLPEGYRVKWMDGHRWAAVSQGKVAVFDFDGINLRQLTTANDDFLPVFDRNFDNLYTFGPSTTKPGSAALLRTSLRVQRDQ